MKIFQNILLNVTLAICIISCETTDILDFVEKSGEVVVNGLIEGKKELEVHISKSMSLNDTNDINYINNASIQLLCENQYIGDLEFIDNGRFKLNDYYTVPNKEYEIKVNTPGFPEVTSHFTIPDSVAIIKVDTLTIDKGDWLYEKFLNFKVNFNDPENIENFYFLEVKVLILCESDFIVTEFDTKDLTVELLLYPYGDLYAPSTDIFGEDMGYNRYIGMVFSDNLFDGRTHTISLNIKKLQEVWISETEFNLRSFTKAVVILKSISKDYYLYLKSREYYRMADVNPFAEKSPVYSNVENGLGFVASYSQSTYPIDIK